MSLLHIEKLPKMQIVCSYWYPMKRVTHMSDGDLDIPTFALRVAYGRSRNSNINFKGSIWEIKKFEHWL